jgi:hypothetical protein
MNNFDNKLKNVDININGSNKSINKIIIIHNFNPDYWKTINL